MGFNRTALIGLSVFVAVGAIGGGIGLAFFDGLGMSVEELRGTPFSDYVIPGLILLFGVGGSALIASWALLTGHQFAAHMAFISAAILTGWIAVQVALVGYLSFLQPMFLIIGLVMMALAVRFWQEHSYRRV